MAASYAKVIIGRMQTTPQNISYVLAYPLSSRFQWLLKSRDYSTAAAEESRIDRNNNSDVIYTPPSALGESFATVPITSASGSIIGKRFYKKATIREAEDGNGWNVMLDYRTLRTPSKRPLKLPTLALASAIAAEWEYQLKDGIRPFTMPLMRLSCTALERVPLTRDKIVQKLLNRFHTDLVFCRPPEDNVLTSDVHVVHVQLMDPLLDWMESQLGSRPVIYTSIFAGRQPKEVVDAVGHLLKKTSNWELAAIDSLAASANSLSIAMALLHGRLGVEEAMKLSRLEEDLQIAKCGLVEGGHDIDMADLRVQISSPIVLVDLVQN
ncbi:hypothetical protein SUGI_0919710 [Cryptomeria japonica]|uniref:uncharacterized protein LOC131033007 n=1 Tax=Cryptomeria japonica TaxID=3369 RepID=UPI002414BD37|nr:uncharacterized protein LOC131033007 [Cryptomeria japonica]GLJ44101.1 hypothetical protein SUGI_0919710 [Cryptomeria japonica]